MVQVSYPDDFSPAHLHCKRDDRREFPRLRCKGTAEICFLELGTRAAGTLLDLSAAGCCIETESPLPFVESPSVQVLLAVNGIRLCLAGVVRNMRKGQRAGIEFIDVTSRKSEQITALVAELIEQRGDLEKPTPE